MAGCELKIAQFLDLVMTHSYVGVRLHQGISQQTNHWGQDPQIAMGIKLDASQPCVQILMVAMIM